LHLPGEMSDPLAGQDLPRSGPTTQTSGEVECASPVARLQRNGLACIESDANGEWEGRIGERFLQEPILCVRGGDDRLARRIEDREGFVPSELDHGAAVLVDHFPTAFG